MDRKIDQAVMTAIEQFHSHLENCCQCREHPFELCGIGSDLLNKAAQEAAQEDVENFAAENDADAT